MSFARLLLLLSLFLFGGIFLLSLTKKKNAKQNIEKARVEEVSLEETTPFSESDEPQELKHIQLDFASLPQADRVDELFNVYGKKLPIVETISYSSRVAWLKGRPAWLSDYARYFQTPIHFISRSLSQAKDYRFDNVSNGDRFNIYDKNKKFEFHLVLDLSLLKMWLYYLDKDSSEKTLLKVYPVGLGRLDQAHQSGSLTPLGVYSLGKKTAMYQSGMHGYFNRQKVEMIRVFGTRWIPFEEEIRSCTAPAKGFGIHGLPWDEESGTLSENKSSIGKYESDGCIRMAQEDIEELFAIITTKPAFIHLLENFEDLDLSLSSSLAEES